MVVFGSLVTLVLIIAGLLWRRNIYLTAVSLIWIWLIMSFNYDGVDYSGNEIIYLYADKSAENFPLSLLNYFSYMLVDTAHELSLDYWEYNGVVVTVLLSFLGLFLLKNVRNHTAYLSLFMIYPMMDSVFQKRFFIAMMLCMFSLWYAAHNERIKYMVLAIISMGFHFTAVFSVLYVLIAYIREKSKLIVILLFFCEIAIILFFKDYILMIMAADNAKISEYIGGNAISIFAGISYIATQVVFVYLTDIILRNYVDDKSVDFIRGLNISSLFFMPFLMADAVFFRFYRIIMMIVYVYVVDSLSREFGNGRPAFYGTVYIVLLFSFVLVTASFDKIGWELFLETLFRYNKAIEGMSL